ncbi:hypothetical protein Cpir12675_005990 [Ceratocystis pirilliformis]|uniref:Uncharacterized protein n=1 Tax=Ceratocystis pirilliformis TaxID=259994 RepID=A0ABR3YM01_9PEZI
MCRPIHIARHTYSVCNRSQFHGHAHIFNCLIFEVCERPVKACLRTIKHLRNPFDTFHGHSHGLENSREYQYIVCQPGICPCLKSRMALRDFHVVERGPGEFSELCVIEDQNDPVLYAAFKRHFGRRARENSAHDQRDKQRETERKKGREGETERRRDRSRAYAEYPEGRGNWTSRPGRDTEARERCQSRQSREHRLPTEKQPSRSRKHFQEGRPSSSRPADQRSEERLFFENLTPNWNLPGRYTPERYPSSGSSSREYSPERYVSGGRTPGSASGNHRNSERVRKNSRSVGFVLPDEHDNYGYSYGHDERGFDEPSYRNKERARCESRGRTRHESRVSSGNRSRDRSHGARHGANCETSHSERQNVRYDGYYGDGSYDSVPRAYHRDTKETKTKRDCAHALPSSIGGDGNKLVNQGGSTVNRAVSNYKPPSVENVAE